MKRYCSILFLLLTLVVSCSKPEPVASELMRIDTLLQHDPSDALQKLLSCHSKYEVQETSLNYNDSYRSLLLSEALYKNDYAQTNRLQLHDAMHYFDSLAKRYPDNDDFTILSARSHYMNDFSGQIFYDEINNNTPGEYYYAFGEENANGQNFGDYDFKAINSEGIDQDFLTQYYYRGMLFDYGNGIYISTARDIGNFVAGFVAGKNGVGFVVARFGFDWYQGGIEPKVLRRAQNKGYFWGLRCFFGF